MSAADKPGLDFSPAALEPIFAPFLRYRHVALAVSGGADSLALMVLAAQWQRSTRARVRLSVLTVDHQLRADSASETQFVVQRAERAGLPVTVLAWAGQKPKTGIQQAARCARYGLMTAWAQNHQADVIATAHTADDQAETLLMRLKRGSGVEGLAAMREHGDDPWPLVRPFLALAGERLRDHLRFLGETWIEDPSNGNAAFERVRIRNWLAQAAAQGFAAQDLALAAKRIGRADAALNGMMRQALERHVRHLDPGYVMIDRQGFAALPAEIRIRMLAHLARCYGAVSQPNLSVMERLDDWVRAGDGRARTQAGFRLTRRAGELIAGRDPHRILPEPVRFAAPDAAGRVLWDGRYWIAKPDGPVAGSISVAPLQTLNIPAPWRHAARRAGIPAFVINGLPAVLQEGKLIALPPVGAQNSAAGFSFRHIAQL